ncbi:MAG: haloacid dehalogenase type II [candidate division Zixibacteria bacterium]|nr:haloacid dehalogenase type II [candidate division Zixibacteria bacterium]
MVDFGRFEVLTFDCYGTLIDWETGILSVLKPILFVHRKDLPDERILELYGQLEAEEEKGKYLPYRQILQNVVKGFGQKLGFVPSAFERKALPKSLKFWSPFPDTIEALGKLKTKFKLAIISNTDDALFAQTAKHIQVKFDWVITAEQVKSYKPSLNNFQQALKKIGIPPEKILHVAQSVYHDIIPAKNLGLATVLVRRRGAGATLPAEGKPDLEVPDLKTLASMV